MHLQWQPRVSNGGPPFHFVSEGRSSLRVLQQQYQLSFLVCRLLDPLLGMSAALVRDQAVRGRVGLWGRLFGPAVYWTDVLKRENDENNEADVLPLLARSSSWHARGLFQAPRLRSEDDALTPAALTSHEQFFNVCFAYAFNRATVERYLVRERDAGTFLLDFLAFWSAWSAGDAVVARASSAACWLLVGAATRAAARDRATAPAPPAAPSPSALVAVLWAARSASTRSRTPCSRCSSRRAGSVCPSPSGTRLLASRRSAALCSARTA